MRVLVTGGAGFIGANLVRTLLGRGHECAVLDSFATGNPTWLVDLSVAVHEGDVRQAELVDRLAAGADAIVHLGAVTGVPPSLRDPLTAHRVNVDGTLNVLQAARAHGGHVLLAGSAAVYGPTPPLPTSEDCPPNPISPYAATKLAAEQYALAWSASYGIDVLPLRFFNVYGPRQDPKSPYSGVISIFMDRSMRGDDIVIFGDGEQTRDFVYVGDVADAILAACFVAEAPSGAVNVGTGKETTINQLASVVCELHGGKSRVAHAEARPGEILRSCADVSAAKAALGFEAKVAIAEGLRETAAWLKG